MGEDLNARIWTKQEGLIGPAFDPNAAQRTEGPVLQVVGDQLQLTEIPLFRQEPPKDNQPTEFQKQLPYIVASAVIGILIERFLFKKR